MTEPKHLLAGMRRWCKRNVPKSADHRSWDWDLLFGYVSGGWEGFRKEGSLCVMTDAVWLSGEDTGYYNFLDPISDFNSWAPVQVIWSNVTSSDGTVTLRFRKREGAKNHV